MEKFGVFNCNVAEERKANISMLNELSARLKEYSRLYQIYQDLLSKLEELNEKLKTPKPRLNVTLLLIGIFLPIVGVIFGTVLDDNLIVVVAGIVIGVALIVTAIVTHNNKVKKFIANFIVPLQEEIAKTEKEAEEARETAAKYLKDVVDPYVDTIVPEKFAKTYCYNIYAIDCMLGLLTDLRADTIKETINLYEEEEFRKKEIAKLTAVERATNRSAAANERSAAANERSAVANERSAAANERSASANEAAAVAATATAASMASIAKSQKQQAKAADRQADAVDRALRD